MPQSKDRKREYMRAYMRRRRAQARKSVTPYSNIGVVTVSDTRTNRGTNRPGKRLRATWRMWWHRWLHRRPWYLTADQEEIVAARQVYRRELSGLVAPVSIYPQARRYTAYVEKR